MFLVAITLELLRKISLRRSRGGRSVFAACACTSRPGPALETPNLSRALAGLNLGARVVVGKGSPLGARRSARTTETFSSPHAAASACTEYASTPRPSLPASAWESKTSMSGPGILEAGGGGRTRTYEGLASGFTVRPLCRSGHSPAPMRQRSRDENAPGLARGGSWLMLRERPACQLEICRSSDTATARMLGHSDVEARDQFPRRSSVADQ